MANDKDSSEAKGGSSFFGGLGKSVKDGLGSFFGLGKEKKPIKPLVDKPEEVKPVEPPRVTKPTFEPSSPIDTSPSVEGKKNRDTGEESEEVSGVRQFMKGRDYADFKSSNVASAKYAKDIGELQLGYKNGGKYRYHDVSPNEAKSFYNAGSKGKWVWDKLRVRGTVFGYRKPYEYMADESQGYIPKYHASETHRQEHHEITPSGHTPQSWQQGQGPYRPNYGKPAKHAHPFPMGKQKVVGKLTTEEYEKKDKHKDKIPVAKHAPPKQSGPTAAEELASVFAMGEKPAKAKKPFAKPAHEPMKTPEPKPTPAEPAKRAGSIGTGAISSVLGGIKAGASKLGSLFGFGPKPKRTESPAKSAHKSNQDRQAKRKGQHKAEGGFVEHMADGGSPGTTQILADDGEMVVKDTEAKKPENAALLEAINSSKSPTLSAGGHSDVPTHQGESTDKSSGGEIKSKLGTPGLDNEPVDVKKDSFVVNANASKEFKPVIEAMNQGQDVAGEHRLDGGFVGIGQHLAMGGAANGTDNRSGNGSSGVPDIAAPGETESSGATQNPTVPSQVRSQESLSSSAELVSSPVEDAIASWKSLYARIADPSLTYPEIDAKIAEPFKKLTIPQLKEVGAGVGKTIMPGSKAKMVAQFVRMVKDQKENWERLQPMHKAEGGSVAKPGVNRNTQSEAFKKWFGESKAVDKDGKPKVHYHGSKNAFEAFDIGRTRDIGAHFGTNEQSENILTESEDQKGSQIYPVYLSTSNPLRIDDVFSRDDRTLFDEMHALNSSLRETDNSKKDQNGSPSFWQLSEEERDGLEYWKKHDKEEFWNLFQSIIESRGHDGIVYQNEVEGGGDSFAVFKPTQIKSAIANQGTYSPTDPRMHKAEGGFVGHGQHLSGGGTAGGDKPAQTGFVGMGEKPSDKPAPTFYSRLQLAIQSLGDKPIPAEAVKNRLKKAGKEGFSDEEWQWTGMDAALEGKKSVTREELLKHFGENQVQVGEVVKGDNLPESETTYSKYQTPGGDDYREMLLTLPQKTKPLSEKEEERYFDLQVGLESLSLEDANEFSQLSARKNKRFGEDFVGNHWDEPNVLAHIRMNDRIGKDGEKILHVEEIQSDWHQEGREKGYKGQVASDVRILTGEEAAEQFPNKWGGRHSFSEGYVAVEENGAPFLGVWGSNLPTKEQAIEKVQEQKDRYAVPNAPFKENWHELALKRIIRHAAENDYARITLNSGEQINKVLNPGTGDADSLQGQKAFYDTTLPNTMAKLGKPFGAKVEPYTISEAPPIADYDRFGNPVDKHGKQIKHDAEIGVTSLPITPELKKSALGKGFPHMAKGGSVQHLSTGGTAGGKSSGWLGKAFGAIGGMLFGLGSHPEASGTQQIAPGQAVISPQEQAVQRSSDLPPTSIKQPPMAALLDDAADAEPTVIGGVAPYKWTPPEPSDWGAGLANLHDNPPAELPIISQLEKRKGPQSELRSFLRKHQPDGGIKLLPHNEALQNMRADEERIRQEEEARKGFMGRLGFSGGGQVPGFPGVGENEDEVPAKLTKGEEVTRKEQAEKYRPLLKAINADQVPQGEELQRLAGGGGKKGGHGSFVASGAGDGWNHYDRGSEGENGVEDDYGGYREEEDDYNPAPKKVVNYGAPKPRAKAVRKTLHGIVMDKGGISAESLKTAGYNLDELKENGLGQLIRKDGSGIPIDELTSSLHHAGHIAFPGAEHGSSKMPLGAEQFLLDQLEAKAHSLHADKDDEHEDEYEAYMREEYERQQYEAEQQAGGLAPINQSLSNEYDDERGDDRGDAYEDEFASPYKEGEVEPWNKSDDEISADYQGFFNDEMKRQADKKKSQELQQWFNEETKQKKASPAKVDRKEKTQKQPLVSMAKKEEEKPAEPMTPINQPLKSDEQSSAEMQRIFDEKMRRENKAVSSVSQVSKPPARLPAFDTETGQPIVGEEGRPEGPKESAEGWAKRAPSAVMKRISPIAPVAPTDPEIAELPKSLPPVPSVRPPSYNTETGQRLYGGEGQPEGPNESPEGWAKRAPAALAKRSGLSLVDHASEMPKQGPDDKLLDRANDAFAKLSNDADKFPEHIKAITATFNGLQSAVKRFENAIADTSGTIAEQNVRKKYAESVLNEKLKAANESPVKGIGEVIAASIKDTLPGLLQSGLTGMAYKAGGPLAGIMAHPVAGAFAQHLDAQGEGGKGGIAEMLGSLFRKSKPEVGAAETATPAAKPMAAVVQTLTPVEPEKPVEQPKATVTGGWGGGWDDAKNPEEQPAESRAKPEEKKPGIFQRMKGWFAKGEEYKGGATVTSGWGGGWEDGSPANEQPAESRSKDDKEEPKKPGLFGRFKNWFGDGGKPPTGGGNTTAAGGMGGGEPPGGGVPGVGAAAEGGGGAMAAAGPAAIALGAALALNKAIDAVSGSLLGANDALIGFGTGLARSVGVPKEIADLGGAVANLFSPLRLAADGLKLFQFAAMPLLNLDKPGELLKSTFTAIADVGKAFVAVLWSARDPVQMLTAAVSPFVNQVSKWNPAAIDRMNLAFDNLSAAAGRMFAPIITAVTGFADELNVLYTSIAPEMESLVQSVVDPIRDFGREFAVGFVGVVREGIPVFRGMMEDMKPLGPMVSAGIRLMMDGVNLFVSGAGQAVSFLTPIFTAIMDEVTPAFRVGAEIVRGLFQTFIGVKDAVMLVVEGLRPLFTALVTVGVYTNPVVFAFVTLASQTKNLTAVFAASAGTLADIIRRLRESPTSPIRAIREGFAGFGARFDASLSRMNTPNASVTGNTPLTGPTTTAAQQARHVGIEDVGLEARRAAYSQGADVASQTAANTAATVQVLRAIERLLQAGNVTAANAANFQNQLLAQQGVMS